MIWNKKNKELEEDNLKLIVENAEHKVEVKALIEKIDFLLATKPQQLSAAQEERLAELEVKMAKLWAILLEKTPNGKEKPTKYGAGFATKLRPRI